MAFWSKESRAKKFIDQVSAFSGFKPVRLTLTEFEENWQPGMERDGLSVGLNWSGRRGVGYDVPPADVRASLAVAKG